MATGVLQRESHTRTRDDYVIGWISALAIESAASIMMLDERHDNLSVAEGDSNTYTLGKIGTHNVVMACMNEAGGLPANIAATDLMKSFRNVRYILMVGIGGGIPSSENQVRLGDVVVSQPTGNSSGVVQTDFGKWEESGFHIMGTLNRPATGLIRAMGKVKIEEILGDSRIHSFVKHRRGGITNDKRWQYQGWENDPEYREDPEHRQNGACSECESQKWPGAPDPRVHYGIIASGNQVIKNREKRDRLGSQLGACCVEMEAFGLMNNFPCLVIRGIADYADGRKDDRWHRYASLTAAAYAKELLISLPSFETDNAPTMDQQLVEINRKLDGIETNIHEVKQSREDYLRNEICDWLSPLNPAAKHEDIRSRHVPGTSISLLEEFHKWRLNQESYLLFALGVPGSGKTQATFVLIDHLIQVRQNSPKMGIAYIYMDLNDQKLQTTKNVIGAITKQLLRDSPNIPPFIEKMWRKQRDSVSKDMMLEMLHEVLKHFEETFVCIDALDEHESRTELLDYLKPAKGIRFRLICTGREHIQPTIATKVEEPMLQMFRIRAQESDVEVFIKQEIETARIEGGMPIDSSLEDEIIQKLLKLCDGVFLIPFLHIKLVLGERANRGERTITDCRNSLKSLQSGLSPAFQDMITRIESETLAPNILTWVWLAVRPLTVAELLHALAVRVGDENLNKESLPIQKHFLRCCMGMVTIDTETQTVRFFHSSLKDYFSERGSAPGTTLTGGHNYIARTCLTYIQFQPVCQNISLQSEEHFMVLEMMVIMTYPFLRYAACYWGYHLRTSGQEDEELVKLARSYLVRDPQERHWSHLQLCKHILRGHYASSEESFVLSFSQWHIIGYFGIHALLLTHKPLTRDLNSKDSKFGRSPTLWAALEGHSDTVRSFLARDADPRSEDYQKRTALSHAAASGHNTIVQLLLESNVDINATDISGGTALHWAALKGHEHTMSTLLEYGANIHTEDVYGGTPLAWSIDGFTTEGTRFLLDKGADSDYLYGAIAGTIEPIFSFAISNDFQVSHLKELRCISRKKYIDDGFMMYSLNALNLLEVNDRFNDFIRVAEAGVSEASARGKMQKVKETAGLTTGYSCMALSIDKAERQQVTPLSHSLAIDNVAAAELILHRVVNPDDRGTDDRTPLSYAAGNGSTRMVKLLLERKADPNYPDETGRTPLSYAVGNKENILQELLKIFQAQGSTILQLDATTRLQLERTHATRFNGRPYHVIRESFCRWPQQDTTQDEETKDQISTDATTRLQPERTHATHQDTTQDEETKDQVARLLLEKNAVPDATDYNGRTPLSYAAERSVATTIKLLLLEKDVNPDSIDKNGRSPLSYAAQCGAEAVAGLLLEKNVKLDLEDVKGRTPLFYASAAKGGHEMIARELLERGANPGKKDREGVAPLSVAIMVGHTGIVNLMLPRCDLDSSFIDEDGRTLLFHAAKNNLTAVVDILLGKNLDPNSVDRKGDTPLLLAAQYGHGDIVRLLLEKGALKDTTHERDMTPLFWAAALGRGEVVRILLEKGADPNYRGRYNMTALFAAVIMGQEAEARALIAFGADINARADTDVTPLFAAVNAVRRGDSVTKLLLESGADPNLENQEGETPLFSAVYKGNGKVVETLLDHGVNPYHKSNNGTMPLCTATYLKKTDVIKIFFEHRVSTTLWEVQCRHYNPEVGLSRVETERDGMDVTDSQGRTALSYAAGAGYEKATKQLSTMAFMREIEDKTGRTPLYYAIDSGKESILTILLEEGSDPNHRDKSGSTPLLYAIATGKESMVQILLDSGADVNAEDDEGKTALYIAVNHNFRGISQLLLTHFGGFYNYGNFHICQKCVQSNIRCQVEDEDAIGESSNIPGIASSEEIAGTIVNKSLNSRKRQACGSDDEDKDRTAKKWRSRR